MSGSQLFPVNLNNLTAKERHNYILNHYVLNSPAEAESRRHKRDIDVIRENHRFLWDDEEADTDSLSWEQRLALRYYKKLFKEYCIADLSRYKENKIALRWRTEQEVVTGTGQFQCGSRHCGERENLRSWEVNFKYIEKGAPLNALVKVRLCPTHTDQLNYRTKKREYKKQRRRAKEERRAERKRKRRRLDDEQESSTDSEEEEEEAGKSATESQPETNEVPTTEDTPADDQIWQQQPDLGQEQTSREQEFERYLEDLLF
ncbi:protein FRA10AC1 homolog [Drosophila subpulchrella]|uniref:protein FRA10AC1 homolog n=1 Tax=Drosophila subpulchrella TaxID=1486046 RepID=UPI0018A14389|nr:protein FRA10AC1 homolog [Drosophila subpulchrella]